MNYLLTLKADALIVDLQDIEKSRYLVNKPLQAAGMSAVMFATERLPEKWIFGREAKLRGQMWNFEDNLSAKDIINRHTSKPERGSFIL